LVDGILEHIGQALSRREVINLRGFGSFRVLAKAERVGMNIRKREKVVITARQVVTFRPGAEMRCRVEKGVKGH
jgi:nucleoid DNA-binding protein